MGWLGIVLSVVAAWLLRDDGWLWLVAAAVALLQVWSYGIMHHHAVESAKKRLDYRGGFFDLNDRDMDAVPNWLTIVNMVGFAAAVGLLVAGFLRCRVGSICPIPSGQSGRQCCELFVSAYNA